MKRKQFIWILPVVLLAVLSCCKDHTAVNRQRITGTWIPADEGNRCGYRFTEDGTCYRDIGFFEYSDSARATFAHPVFTDPGQKPDFHTLLNSTIRYYRSNTSYQVRGDTLELIDPSHEGWTRRHIRFHTSDTLILSGIELAEPEKYIREKPEALSDEPLFDQVLIYRPETPFSCRKYFSLRRDGLYMSWGDNGMPGDCIGGTMKAGDYEKLEKMFRKARIENYLDTLHVNRAFAPDEPCIRLIGKGEVYTLRNDLDAVPLPYQKAYYQAYFSALFYPDNLYFYPDKRGFYYPAYEFETFELWDRAGKRQYVLSEMDRYMLAVLFIDAPKTESSFQPRYIIRNGKTGNELMQTDGRYFRYKDYYYPNQDIKLTHDLGFNFIEANGLDRE